MESKSMNLGYCTEKKVATILCSAVTHIFKKEAPPLHIKTKQNRTKKRSTTLQRSQWKDNAEPSHLVNEDGILRTKLTSAIYIAHLIRTVERKYGGRSKNSKIPWNK